MKRILLSILLGLYLGFSLAFFVHQSRLEEERREEEARRNEAIAEGNARLDACRRVVSSLQTDYVITQKERLARYEDPSVRDAMVRAEELPLFAIGDSVMLGAKYRLEQRFPRGEINARENRSYWPAYTILEEKKEAGTEFYPIVIGIGTNSPLDLSVCRRIIELCEEKEVFWITTTNNWQFYNTDKIWQLEKEYENLTVIDWDSASHGHEEYFYSDAIHLTEEGRIAYADLIYRSISDRLFSLTVKDQHRLYLAGDAYLLSSIQDLSLLEGEAYVLAEEELSLSLLEKRTKDLSASFILPEETVLVFSNSRLSDRNLSELIDRLFKDQPLKLVVVNDSKEEDSRFLPESVPVFEYTPEEEDYSLDGKHLTASGAKRFAAFLNDMITAE